MNMQKNMRKLKRLFATLLAVTVFANMATAITAAYTLTDNDVVVTNGVITSCSYDFTIKNIIIPSTLDGQTVIDIQNENFAAPDCFMGRGISQVTLPSTLTRIGDYAFKGNQLTSVTIPTGVKYIGASAFDGQGAGFTSVVIPTSVLFIGRYAFYNDGITTLTLPTPSIAGFQYWLDVTNNGAHIAGGESITYNNSEFSAKIIYTLTDNDVVVNAQGIITSCSYDFANGFKDIIIPSTLDGVAVLGIADGYTGVFENKGIVTVVLPSTMETIGESAFSSNDLKEIILPQSLKTIGIRAFEFNDITEIILPNNLTSIGMYAFFGDNIAEITLPTPPNNEFEKWIGYDGTLYNVGSTIALGTYASFTAKYVYTLKDEDVVVTNGVIQSCSYNFDIKYIVIPSTLDGQTVTGIAKGSESQYYVISGVFYHKGIKEVELPSTLESVGDYAFNYNELTQVTLPNSVSYIGVEAFFANGDLGDYIFPLTQKANSTFTNWKSSTNTTYEAGVVVPQIFGTSYTAQFSGSSALRTLTASGVAVKAYPNPTQSVLTIEISEMNNYTIVLLDVSGVELIKEQIDAATLTLDLNKLPKGIYLLKVSNLNGDTYTDKIIRN